jgi:hypothetical protein
MEKRHIHAYFLHLLDLQHSTAVFKNVPYMGRRNIWVNMARIVSFSKPDSIQFAISFYMLNVCVCVVIPKLLSGILSNKRLPSHPTPVMHFLFIGLLNL